jgi:7,8-dihydropterin-6-yl-methyl-4-(beta-D-ribofuranosyl)aminobenzene 5'-phosphate synthase
MKITILYDNIVFLSGLKPDWGFSCLVETHNRNILFDTGSNGSILLENMKKLDIDPLSIDEVFISHAHFDHVGGLSAFLNENNNVKIYVPISLRGIRNAKEIIYVDEPMTLHENIFSTGELDHIEQSMAVKTDKGLVLIAGCSHPKMKNILKAASQFGKVHAIIGGLHGFNEFELFKDLGVICPTHCTQYIAEIKSLYPEKYIEGGAGKIIEI